MGVLRNPLHERIAQAAAAFKTTESTGALRPKTAEEVCLEVGMQPGRQSRKGWQGNCRKLCNRRDIRSRVEEIQGVAAELAEIDAGWIMLKAKRLLGWNLDDFLGPVQANGCRYFDLSRVSREQLAVLAEFSQDEEFKPGKYDKDGNETEEPLTIRKIRIKPNNQVALLDLLARMKGLVNSSVALTDPAGGPVKMQLEVSWRPTQLAPAVGRAA